MSLYRNFQEYLGNNKMLKTQPPKIIVKLEENPRMSYVNRRMERLLRILLRILRNICSFEQLFFLSIHQTSAWVIRTSPILEIRPCLF